MKNLINRFCFATLLCCGLFMLQLPARAQPPCPDSTGPAPNPSTDPWTQLLAQGSAPCGLPIDVYYCARKVLDTATGIYHLQVWIDSVVALEDGLDTACFDTMSAVNIIYDADSIVYAGTYGLAEEYNISCWCNDNCYSVIFESYLPECWMQQTYSARIGQSKGSIPLSGTNKRAYSGCSEPGVYCVTTCDLCWTDPTTSTGSLPVYSNCETYSTGTPTCVTINPNQAWLNGVCYNLGCNFNAPGNIIEPLGITSPSEIDKSLTLYPNPVRQSLTIVSAKLGEHISVLDVLGREVLRGNIPAGGSLVLDVSSLSEGTYYISGGHKELKFVKK